MGKLRFAVKAAKITGKVVKISAKTTYKTVKVTGRATIDAGKILRKWDKRLTTKPVTTAMRTGQEFAKQQVRSVDAGKGIMAAGGIAADTASMLHQYRQQRKTYHGYKHFDLKTRQIKHVTGTKAQYKFQKQNYKSIKAKRKAAFTAEKLQHKNFQTSSKLQIQVLKAEHRKPEKRAWKKKKKAENKSYKQYRKTNKRACKSERKLKKNQKQIKKLSKPKLATGSLVVGSAKRQLRSSLMDDGGDNEFVQAAAKLSAIQQKTTPKRQSKLHKAQARTSKLQKKAGKGDVKLHQRQTNLQRSRKQQPPKKKRKKKTGGKRSGIVSTITSALTSAPEAIKALGSKVFVAVLPYLLIAGLISSIALPLTFVSNVGQNSSFVMGTYASLDSDLSAASEYYTKLAYSMNEAVMLCGSAGSWKTGLQYFGVSKQTLKSYKDTPDSFVFKQSGYDFDYWKLYSFLCAYFYEYDEDEDAVVYWEYNDNVETVIRDLFHREYEFQYTYENGSHWKQRNSYIFSDGWLFSYPGAIGNADVVHGFFDFDAVPSDLADFSDELGNGQYRIYYNLTNLEILNAQDELSATGWYFQNQLTNVTDPAGNTRNGFYKYIVANYGNGYGFFSTATNGKSYWFERSRILRDYDIPAAVAPRDTLLWRSANRDALKEQYTTLIENYTRMYTEPNTASWDRTAFYDDLHELAVSQDGYTNFGYCTYYKMYDWVTECKLTYTVKKHMTFDEAIQQTLLAQDDGQTLYDYYLLLLGDGDDASISYGNHQTLVSPVTQGLKALLTGDYFVNDYGYDMQEWNSRHCALSMHNGVDIVQNSGSPVYAMFSGEITEAKDGYLVLSANGSEYKVPLWYDDDKYAFKVTYSNIAPIRIKGETVEAGDLIGYTTNARKCYTMNNGATGCDYLHISLEIDYNMVFSDWKTVDPKLLIALDGN